VKTSGAVTAAGYKIPGGTSAQYLRADGTVTTSVTSGIPYTGATQATNLGAYDLTVNGITVGRGSNSFISNTAFGISSLNTNTTGIFNTAFGAYTLASNTTGQHNTAIGLDALDNNSTGNENTALGNTSLFYNTIGDANTAIGMNSLERNTTGSNNTALGDKSALANTTGSNNTIIGYQADLISNNLSNSIAIGYNALVSNSNSTMIGNSTTANAEIKGNLKTNGQTLSLISKTASYTATLSDEIITGNTTSSAFTITLPTAVDKTGQTYTIKRMNSGSNNLTVGTTSSQTIDGSTTYVLTTQYKYVKVVSDGANWIIVGNN
jgi:hypothetical protein